MVFNPYFKKGNQDCVFPHKPWALSLEPDLKNGIVSR